MRMVDLIEKKKYGKRLTGQELVFIANGASDGSIPDYQLAAWLMAVWFNGMSDGETRFFDSYIRKQIAKTLKNRVFFIKKQIFFNLCIE